MSSSLLVSASKMDKVLVGMKHEQCAGTEHADELSDPTQYIIENAKCFLCDRDFVEGEDTFLIFESRLREDGETESPLASVLSAALGKELDVNIAHSALLCASCNKDVLEYEQLLQRFCEMRYRIIAAYNSTAHKYDLDPIAVEINGVLQNVGIVVDADNKKADEEVVCQSDGAILQLAEKESVQVLTPKAEGDELIDECTDFSSNVDELLIEKTTVADLVEHVYEEPESMTKQGEKQNDPSKYAFAIIDVSEEPDVQQYSMKTEGDELNVASLQIDGQDIIIYGDIEQDSQMSYNELDEDVSSQSVQDPDSNSGQAAVLFAVDDAESANTLVLDKDELARPLFEQQGDMYVCLQCADQLEPLDTKSFSGHMRSVHNLRFYSCAQCHAGFLTRHSLKQHIDEHHLSIDGETGSSSFVCDICQRVFTSYCQLRVHHRIHYGNAKLYECAQCNKKFSCTALLLDHMNMHTGKRPYKCSKCPKDFASRYTLQAHTKIHSERQRPYKCDICDKAFLNQQTLTYHKKLHSNVRAFVCDVCSKAFGTQHNLDLHRIVHTGQRPFICRTCGKAFARRAEIRDHERIHTGEKPFKCDMCDAAFAQRSNLMSHRKSTHLNEKMHKCDQCERSFKRRRLLQYHINAAHTGERPHKCDTCGASFVYPEHQKKHMLIHADKKPFACEVCGKEFNSRDNRNAHRFVHSDKKPYECVECGAGFMRKPLLLAHMNHAQHNSDTIIVNQAQISKNGTLSLISEVNAIDTREETDEGSQALAVEVTAASSSTEEESLQHILADVDDLGKQVEGEHVKYLQFEDLEKEGQQILTWMDIGSEKD